MDVVGPESSSPFTTSIEISAQRKSRQILMHIETLYRIVLKLEDLENPTAIATFLVVKVNFFSFFLSFVFADVNCSFLNLLTNETSKKMYF